VAEADLFKATLSGDVDMTRLTELKKIADAFRSGSCTNALIDVSAVTFMDSTGLGMLSQMRNTATSRQGTVTLLDPTPSCLSMLRIVGFGTVFVIERSR
jgi:anti-sigma B factor antagonist